MRPAAQRASLSSGTKLQDVSFDLYPGEVLGVVALEGQGQDELFDILAGQDRPSGAGSRWTVRRSRSVTRGTRSALGRVRCCRSCRGPAHAALGAREHRAAVAGTSARLGTDRSARGAEARDMRGHHAPDRHSGRRRGAPPVGRQPAEGDDRAMGGGRRADDAVLRSDARDRHRHEAQIYLLLRDLAEAGAAVLLYTSELKEIQLVCDRAIVIFGGRVVREMPAPTRTSRRSCGRPTICAGRRDARGRRRRARRKATVRGPTRSSASPEPRSGRRSRHDRGRDRRPSLARFGRSSRWSVATAGPSACSAARRPAAVHQDISPTTDATALQGLAIGVLPWRSRQWPRPSS